MQRRTLTWLMALLGGLALASSAGSGRAGGVPATAEALRFASIDGGTLDLADFRGGPVLVVNTASRCGFTSQLDGLQALYDRYHDRGLTVVGVPSNSFRQELADEGAVKEFCEVNFSITFPMTGIVAVRGGDAHPFYAWAHDQGITPGWNFTKILLDRDGAIQGSFGPMTAPDDPDLIGAIEPLLNG